LSVKQVAGQGVGALWDCVPRICGGGGGCAGGGVPLGAVPVLSWCGEVSLGSKQSSSTHTQLIHTDNTQTTNTYIDRVGHGEGHRRDLVERQERKLVVCQRGYGSTHTDNTHRQHIHTLTVLVAAQTTHTQRSNFVKCQKGNLVVCE